MAIHHSTIKRAEKAGIILEQIEQGYSALWAKHNYRLVGENPKYLLEDMLAIQKMKEDYPSFKYTINEDGTVNIEVRGTDIAVSGLRAYAAFEQAKRAWQQSREDLDEDDEEADNETQAEVDEQIEEEEGPSGSVVSERYRAKYAELGHPTHCGDWLALLLNNLTTNDAGVNVPLLEAICAHNGVSLDKYKRTGTGWQGRLRMTARNILARLIWLDGGKFPMPDTVDGGKVYQAPADWMEGRVYKATKAKAAKKPEPEEQSEAA